MKRIILAPDSRDAIPFSIHDDFIAGVKVILDGIGGFMVRFNKLSTYGIMKDYSNEELKNFINTLVSHGFLDIRENPSTRGSFPTVCLNNQSIKVLKGELKVEFKEIKVAKEFRERNELFEILSDLSITNACAPNTEALASS